MKLRLLVTIGMLVTAGTFLAIAPHAAANQIEGRGGNGTCLVGANECYCSNGNCRDSTSGKTCAAAVGTDNKSYTGFVCAD